MAESKSSITKSKFQEKIDNHFKHEKMFFNILEESYEGGDGHGFFDHIRKIPMVAGVKSLTAETSPSGDKTYSIQFNGKNQSGGHVVSADRQNTTSGEDALIDVKGNKKKN